MSQVKKYKVVTLGCRTNQYESQAYVTQLEKLGCSEATNDEKADLCIVNTCTVTAGADRSSRGEIRKLARSHPGAEIVITGCLAERLPKEMLAIEGVTRVVSNLEKESLLEEHFPEEDLPEFAIDRFAAHTRAFVKVQDGCNSFCTYCIISYVRGRSRSRPVAEILEEVRGLVTEGFKEVVLTGVNIGDFDGGCTLADLIREVDQVEGLERIRVSSIDPDEVDEDLADAILLSNKTCNSMHIVLQSGSNVILKRMNRKYTKQMFCQTIDYLRGRDSNFTFTTDIIVGFPGESDADFQDTLDIMNEVQFAKVHMFPYSKRERTRAALYKDQIDPKVMEERRQIVMRLSEKNAYDLREKYIGQTMKVLTENGEMGHTENFLPVDLQKPMRANEIVEVEIVGNSPSGLIGIPKEKKHRGEEKKRRSACLVREKLF